jgi:hypothetical protein
MTAGLVASRRGSGVEDCDCSIIAPTAIANRTAATSRRRDRGRFDGLGSGRGVARLGGGEGGSGRGVWPPVERVEVEPTSATTTVIVTVAIVSATRNRS